MPSTLMERVKPVKVGELCFAMELVQKAIDGHLPITDPTQFGFTVEDEDSSTKHYELGDALFTRSMMAIRDYVDDYDKVVSLHIRSWAFADMVKDERIERWKRGERSLKGKPAPIHGAVFVAAAEMPLNDRCSFDSDSFFARVEELAQQYTMNQLDEMLRDGWQEISEAAERMLEQVPILDNEVFVEQRVGVERIGRNAPCPCGSGKKYKKCHGNSN